MPPTPPSPERFKEAVRRQWDEAAGGWNDQTPQIRAWLAEATRAMLDEAGVGQGCRVLDVAAGAGDQTLDIARRVGPKGSVLATDLSPRILALAERNAGDAGLRNVETKVADGEDLGLEGAGFDAAVCRLGLMFFPDPLRGLRGIHGALKPGGRFCALVFSEPGRNPCVGIVMATALKHAGVAPPDPFQPGGLFSLGKPGLIDGLLADAGFRHVEATRVGAPFRLRTAEDYVTFIRTSASPVLAGLDAGAQNAAWAEMTERLAVFQTPTHWEGPNELLLAAGSR
ncbi:MAG: class I SAM-dependent methyltransferase [Geminicoccaceae bacterium]|nr:class I SAM-dependent methyltransferase [Geminicoccaceae bacterium]